MHFGRNHRALAILGLALLASLVSISTYTAPGFAAAAKMPLEYDRAADGEWAVVGVPSNEGYRGAARLYHRSGGSWVLGATLAPPERGPFARFGGSVAISGNMVVVGAPWDDGWKGAAYVYERTAETWTMISRLSPPSSVGDRFGTRVSLTGGIVSLGAEGGAVARFQRSATGWSEVERLADGTASLAPGSPVEASLTGVVEAQLQQNGTPRFVASATAIAPPAFVTATDSLYEDRTEIRWAPVAGGPYLFKIYRRLAGQPASANVLIRVASQDDSFYADATGIPGVVYTYSVTVLDMTNTEGAAAFDNGTRIIFQPTGFTASDATFEGFVRLKWSDRSSIEAGYRIRRNGSLLHATVPNAESFNDDTAVPGTTYSYTVVAFDADGDTTASVTDSGQSAFIAAPLSVSASDGQDPSKVVITWVDNTALEVNYRVYRNGALRITLPADSVSFSDVTATPGTIYEYCVSAVDGSARESARGCDFGGIGVLPAPSHVTASIGTFDDKVTVAWQDTSTTEDGFRVYRMPVGTTASTLVANLRGGITKFDDPGGQPGLYYTYCVEAFSDRGGHSASVCDSGQRAVVIAPKSVAASDGAFEDRVDLAWVSTSTSAVLFKIYRNGVFIRSVSGDRRTYSDDGGASGVTTTYAVTAVTALGVESPMTTDNGFRTIAAPVSVTASDNTLEDRVAVSWTDQSQVEDGFFVSRRLAGTSDPLLRIATRPANTASAEDPTGVPGARYEYFVTAFQLFGPDRADTTESASGTDTGSRSLEVPSSVDASDARFEDKIVVTWEDNSRFEEAYQVWRRSLATNDSALVAVLAPNANGYVDSTGTLSGAYQYSVFAVDSLAGILLGRSVAGKDVGSVALLPPASVNASDTYLDRVVVAWIDQSARESGYRISRDGVAIGTVAANATAFQDLGVSGTHTYCVRTLSSADSSELACNGGGTPLTADTTGALFNARVQETADPGIVEGYHDFGASIDGDGDRLIVGAPFTNHTFRTRDRGAGKVIVYRKTASGFEREQVLAPADTTIDGVEFGGIVALSGMHAVVAALGTGTLYFYERDSQTNVWSLQQTTPVSVASLALDGEWAIVGQPSALRFYHHQGASWTLAQTIASGGYAVGLSGTTAVAGYTGTSAPLSVHVFDLVAGTWTESQAMPEPVPNPYGAFGSFVDIDGDRLVVGGGVELIPFPPGSPTSLISGVVYEYERDPSTRIWSPVTQLRGATRADDASQSSFFGGALSIKGDDILVGAPYDNVAFVNHGAVFHFKRRPDGSWARRELRSRDPQSGHLGSSVLVAGHDLLAGAPYARCESGQSGLSCQPLPQLVGVSYPIGTVEVLSAEINTSPVAAVSASDGSYKDRVQLAWTYNSTDQTAFKLYRDGTLINTTDPAVRAYTDFDAEPGRTHEYCVSIVRTDGTESDSRCDFGRRPPDGNITGRVSTQAGAGVSGAQVTLDPAPNRALLLDGSAGTMTVTDGALFGDAFTLEFWYRGHASGAAGTLLRHANATSPNAFAVINPANLAVIVNGDLKTTGVAVNDGAWHHVAIDRTRAGGALHVYKDGLLAFADTLATGAAIDSAGSLVFGASLPGALDDIRVWKVVRTVAQLDSARSVPLTGSEPGLAAYWPLDAYQGAGAEEPVGSRYGRIAGGAHWIGESAPLLVFAVTDNQGNYVLPRLRYGTLTTFKVAPQIAGHQFSPAFKTITLSTGNQVQNEVGFNDITSFTVSGHVRYRNAPCFAANVEILVDDVVRGATDGNGRYAVPVPPGAHTIEARSAGHTFSPAVIQQAGISGDVVNQDFTDETLRHLSGLVSGGCNLPIGTLTIAIESEDHCFSDTVRTSGSYIEPLPPLELIVRVLDVTAVSGGPAKASLIRFFDDLGSREVDLSTADQTLDFRYRAPLEVVISGLPDPDAACTLGVPVIAQTERYPVTIKVFEDYGSLGTCPVDTGSVTVFDEIIDQEKNPVTLVVHEGEAMLQTDKGLTHYVTAGNTPNIFAGRLDAEHKDRSYQKSLTAVAEVEGQDPVSSTVWAIVTGHRPRTATFTAEAEGIPLLILHDPPGDHSFSFVDQESTFCTKFSNAGLEKLSQGFEGKLHVGVEATLGFIYATPIKAEVFVAGGMTIGAETKQGNELEICAKTSQGYRTSSDNLFIGRDGDVYVGVALNLIFAKTDVIRVQGCQVVPSVEVTYGVDGVQSSYNYTDWHIRNTIIPQLAELARLSPGDSSRFNADRANWEAHLALNDSLERVAPLERNRSFSAGAEYSYSSTVDTARTSTWSAKLFTENAFSTEFEFNVAGIGGDLKFESKMEFNFEREGSSTSSTSRTTGYSLSDDDIGDVFSVNVKKDVMYGTPIFDLAAGTSSCPWEPWPDAAGNARSQPVDGPKLTAQLVSPLVTPIGSPAVFTLNMTNDSQSGSLREYTVMPFQESNPGGAVIKIDGVNSANGVSFFLNPHETRQATMTVERGPTQYFYKDLEIAMVAPCQFELFRNGGPLQLASIAKVEVAFDAPCSDISLVRPQPGWSAGAGTDTLEVVIDKFQLQISENESIIAVGAEYQLAGTDFWVPIGGREILAAEVPLVDGQPQGITIKWPVTGIPAGSYTVRAFTRCGGGKNYSSPASGVVDRAAPQVFGTPQPADGTLSLGEDISITFNEDLDCASANAATVHLETASGTPHALDMQVTCNGRTLVITPTADLSAYEGQLLRATVSGIRDRVGNASGTTSWTFTVRQGEIAWAQSAVSLDVGYGSGGRVAASLVNGLNQRVRYTLSTLPAWLSAEPVVTDTIPAKSQATVAFDVNSATAIGSYDTTVTATATTIPPSFTRSAVLQVHVNVLKVPPTWSVNPADYEQSMTVRAKVYVNADSSVATNDVLGAFVGDQVRGVAHPQHVSDGWRYFLTVYGKPPAFERIRFRVWDSKTSKTWVATDKTVKFSPDTTLGAFASPLEIRTRQPSPANEQVIPINSGWTWISVNRRPSTQDDRTVAAVLSNLIPSPGDMIKAQDGSVAVFDAVAGWIGTLDTLGITKSYRMKTADAGEIRYESARVLPSLYPITVKKGWNWIGYPPDDARAVPAALANYTGVATTDVLRSQSGFTEYSPSTWAGSLATMGPGIGYALYRSSAANGLITYSDTPPALALLPASGSGVASGAQLASANSSTVNAANPEVLPGWEVDDHAYQYDMVVTAQVTGIPLGPMSQVAAVVNGEIRGVARPVEVAALGKTFVFLMVRSNQPGGETVRFQVLDRTTGKIYQVDGSAGFAADAVMGSTKAPITLKSDGVVIATLGLPATFDMGPMRPNPIFGAATATLRYGVSSATRVRLELFDVSGRRVRKIVDAVQAPGWYDVTIAPEGMRGGVYFCRMNAGSFSATRRMVVVR